MIKEDGLVVFDSYGSAEHMDNHLSRPEIASCLSGQDGCSIRKSDTSGIDYIYFARRYNDVIVRTALPFAVGKKRYMHPDWMLLITLMLTFAAGVLAIRQLSLHAGAEFERDTRRMLRSQKKRMTANIAHELRTPVTSIRAYLETMVNNPDMAQDKREQFTSRAYNQTLRLSDLIRDISLITKIEEAPEALSKEYIGVRKLSEEVIEEFSAEIAHNHITICNNIPEHLSIKANASLIYALLRNLIEKSVRYAGSDICICLSGQIKGHFAHFEYSDNGKGVKPEHLEKIFERFYRIPDENAHHSEGSGLGLSIVKNAVTFHGGSIEAQCIEPHGLRFIFTLEAV